MILSLTPDYYRKIAEAQSALDPTAFLGEADPAIGIAFRETIFYPLADKDPGTFVWIDVTATGELAGYVVGTKDVRHLYKQLKWANPLLLGWFLLRSIFKKPLLLKHYLASKKSLERGYLAGDVHAELISLGVLPEYRTPEFESRYGVHIAQALFDKAKETFRDWGISAFKIMTVQTNEAAKKFYEKQGCRLIGTAEPFQTPCFIYLCEQKVLGTAETDSSNLSRNAPETMKPNIVFVRIAPWFDVSHPHPQDTPISYDIAYITAMMDTARYSIRLIDNYIQRFTPEGLVSEILSCHPDVLLVTSEGATVRVARKLFEEVKKHRPDLLTVAFGRQLMYLPEVLLGPDKSVDALILDEPEMTALELIDRMSQGSEWQSVRGIAFWGSDGKMTQTPPREQIKDLDSLPKMNHELFNSPKYRQISQAVRIFGPVRWGFMLTSRGCPYACTFCSPSIRRSYGEKFRARSPKLVVDEMEYLKQRFGVNAIAFGDDVFTIDMKRTHAICDEILRRGLKIKWAIATRADRLDRSLLEK
ncbi:MAG: GNAT family N-acetyltransferase, partial [Candidatus Omnitrophica bacterium]|nr:GNAT family N-acetyltransferase [Candidatus Omnitrophota bacterium]